MSRRLIESAVLVSALLVAACGGTSASAPTTPRPAEDTTAAAPKKLEGEGVADGGAADGGAAPGDIAQQWHDPCGEPMIAEEPIPPDPPELATYLPPGPTTMGVPPLDAAAVYSVPLHDSPAAGPAAAPVTLVATYEFADPYSERMRTTLDELEAHYGADLRIVWKSYIVHHQWGQVPALGGCAAAKQDKFRPFMNSMFEAGVGPSGNRRWDLGAVQTIAANLGLDEVKFDADLRSKACREAIIRDQQLFSDLGQRAVPVAWVNGKPVAGAQPTAAFIEIIDEELAIAKQALAKRGAKVADYYPGLVKRGKKTGP